MARIDTLDNFLTDVADAIRAKTESAGLIPASDFDTEIESIPGAEKYFVNASTSQLNKPYMWIKELPNLDLSTLTSMLDMFYDCTALEKVGTLNIPNVTDIRECFYKCSALTEVSFSNMNINNIRVTDLFKSCSSLTKISGLNLSGASSLLELFANCESLTSSELFNETNTFNTANATNTAGMFSGCKNLSSVPLFDTSHVTDINAMFNFCFNLESLPNFDFSGVTTSISQTFGRCSKLTEVPLFDFSHVQNFSQAFIYCSRLTTVPQFSFASATDLTNMFQSCGALSNDSLNNIMASCIGAVNYTGTKTLKQLGLSQTQATTCATLSNYQNFINAGWTTGY